MAILRSEPKQNVCVSHSQSDPQNINASNNSFSVKIVLARQMFCFYQKLALINILKKLINQHFDLWV